MELVFKFDMEKIINSKIGRFAVNYYDYKYIKKKKVVTKDIAEKIISFLIDLAGELSLIYLGFFTRLWFKSLSKEEIKNLSKGPFRL